MNEEDTKKRLHFLWGASHTLLPTVPGLSAFYMQKFNQCAAEEDLNLADGVKRKFCAHCGNIFVPGMNTQNDLKHTNHRQHQGHKNVLSYVCTLCKTEARFAGSNVVRNILSVDNIINTNKQTQVAKVTNIASTSCNKGSTSIQNQNSVDSNKPKKKKQKTQLQQLLAEEKRKKDESKSSQLSGLNLEDFLSSL
ncbi:15298_t:CDS:2 [Dentiscutata erythropus]|uniref:15298_t:CDS:1 n=1 Tax=Dentiscutata erythropus TaxID=1348616 RepID=A0A9N9CDL4_9GLOM|nr:15298_t:CDS:2 [Dentiscutata erythropus]